MSESKRKKAVPKPPTVGGAEISEMIVIVPTARIVDMVYENLKEFDALAAMALGLGGFDADSVRSCYPDCVRYGRPECGHEHNLRIRFVRTRGRQ